MSIEKIGYYHMDFLLNFMEEHGVNRTYVYSVLRRKEVDTEDGNRISYLEYLALKYRNDVSKFADEVIRYYETYTDRIKQIHSLFLKYEIPFHYKTRYQFIQYLRNNFYNRQENNAYLKFVTKMNSLSSAFPSYNKYLESEKMLKVLKDFGKTD